MKPIALFIFLGAIAAAALPGRGEDPTNGVSRFDLQYFKVISDHNIFNPNRSGRSTNAPAPKPKQVDTFALVGTMTYEKGTFAFFDGSSSRFRKSVQLHDNIAGYNIDNIAANYVTLSTTNAEPVQLDVGMQMKREDEGPWRMAGRVDSADYARSSESRGSEGSSSRRSDGSDSRRYDDSRRSDRSDYSRRSDSSSRRSDSYPSGRSSSYTNDKSSGTSSEDLTEVMKKLMEKRAQEK